MFIRTGEGSGEVELLSTDALVFCRQYAELCIDTTINIRLFDR